MLYELPEEIIDIIFKMIHCENLKILNKEFNNYVIKARYYHTLQEIDPQSKYLRDYFLYKRFKEIDYTECCFRGPKNFRYL